MRTFTLFFKTIFVLLFSLILTNCTGTEVNDEIGVNETEQQAGDEYIDKGDVQHPDDRE